MKKFLMLLILFVISSCVYSNDFIKLSDGSYILGITGESFEFQKPAFKGLKNRGNCDVVLVSFDKDKNIVKKSVFGGVGEECVVDVVEAYGNIYVLGTVFEDSFGTGDFKDLKACGKRDCFIAKFTKDFKLEKTVSFGTEYYDFAEEFLPCETGFVVVGRTYREDNTMEAYISLFDKELNMVNKKEFVSSSTNPNDATATEFRSVTINKNNNFVCVGSVTISDFIDVPGYSILVEYDKNLNIVNKNSIKNPPMSVYLENIVCDNDIYYSCGNVLKDEITHSYIVVLDKNLKEIKNQLYSPKSTDKKYPVYSSIEKISSNPIMAFGFAGKYKGNGDYDDEFYHNFLVPCSKNGFELSKLVKLPKDTYTFLVDGNKVECLIFSREICDEFVIKEIEL